MIIAIDFDGTIVEERGRAYDDLTTPLELMEGARAALLALLREGHTLVLYSARANLALRRDWRLNPLWRDGKVRFNRQLIESSYSLNEARFQQMLRFVEKELSGVFAAIDDGSVGKFSADVYIDDKAVNYGTGIGLSWDRIAVIYGQPGAWLKERRQNG